MLLKFKEHFELKQFLKILETQEIEEEQQLQEAASGKKAAKAPAPVEGQVSNNTKGVMHELLTGYHLNNKTHMENYNNEEGESPKQAHDRLKATMHKNDYKKANARAESAANDIRAEASGHKISKVHWTSKPGDIGRSTGIKSSQKEDPSDIVIHTHHESDKKKANPKFTGISLKISDQPGKHIPSSNLGMSSLGPKSQEIDSARKQAIHKKFPKLAGMGPRERRDWAKENPISAEKVKKIAVDHLQQVAKSLHEHLSNSSPKVVAAHVREVLHAHGTPMEDEGHTHIKHVTYGKTSTKHHTVNPGTDYEDILSKRPRDIEVHHSGASLSFKDKKTGKTFARHSIKYDSQNDPLSSLKSAGTPAGD
jgi:hypothetical protein